VEKTEKREKNHSFCKARISFGEKKKKYALFTGEKKRGVRTETARFTEQYIPGKKVDPREGKKKRGIAQLQVTSQIRPTFRYPRETAQDGTNGC